MSCLNLTEKSEPITFLISFFRPFPTLPFHSVPQNAKFVSKKKESAKTLERIQKNTELHVKDVGLLWFMEK